MTTSDRRDSLKNEGAVEIAVVHMIGPDGRCMISTNGQGGLPCEVHGILAWLARVRRDIEAHAPKSRTIRDSHNELHDPAQNKSGRYPHKKGHW